MPDKAIDDTKLRRLMNSSFTHPPEAYRVESFGYSKIWFKWLPIISIPVLWWVSYWYPSFSEKWLVSEQTGLLEFINALFPLLTALVALRLLFFHQIRSDWFLVCWALAMAVGGIYLAGEEASWGQHYIGWTTPEFWTSVNDQQETNLHNVSHWFDQKPRLILIVGIIVTGIIQPWLHLNRPNVLWRRFDFIYPALALVPLACCVLFTLLISKVWAEAYSFLFRQLRSGELQELYIVWFLLAYSLSLYWRAKLIEGNSPTV